MKALTIPLKGAACAVHERWLSASKLLQRSPQAVLQLTILARSSVPTIDRLRYRASDPQA